MAGPGRLREEKIAEVGRTDTILWAIYCVRSNCIKDPLAFGLHLRRKKDRKHGVAGTIKSDCTEFLLIVVL